MLDLFTFLKFLTLTCNNIYIYFYLLMNMKRYQGQIRHVGRDKWTNISSYNSMNTKQDGGPERPRTRAQSLYKAYYDIPPLIQKR